MASTVPNTDITAHVEAQVDEPADLVFSFAVAQGPTISGEDIALSVDGRPIALREVISPEGARLHLATAPVGQLVLDYRVSTQGTRTGGEVTPIEELEYRRPSRYAESDKLAIVSAKRFAAFEGQAKINAIVDWVHTNLFYVSGSSGPTDGAVDTYFAQQGVCRDFAHLVIGTLRACGFPARLVSCYAPGLVPMDFHAVVEVAHEGRWQVVDATRLAPRGSLIRIAHGRDAADTAFLTLHTGKVQFGAVSVTCYRHGDLPVEAPDEVVFL